MSPKMRKSNLYKIQPAPDAMPGSFFRKQIGGSSHFIISINGEHFVIGAEVAERFHKQTYNIYRSLREKHRAFPLRATSKQVNYLRSVHLLDSCTRSATFLRVDDFKRYLVSRNKDGVFFSLLIAVEEEEMEE